ncbi:MAG TPA: hypothetical protein VIN40_09020 [Candidatus Tyrphobacter sp.]
MPKRLLFAVGILALILAACKSAGTPTPTPTATPSPTPNPSASTATVTATYNGSPYSAATVPPNGSGTIYANAAASGCPGSTTVGGSTLSAQTNASGTATISNLTPNIDYEFFYIASGGPTVSTCTLYWTYATVYLTYP